MVFLPCIAKHSPNWLWMNLFLMCGRCSTENWDGVYMSVCVFVLVSVCSVIACFCLRLLFWVCVSLDAHVTLMQLHIAYTFTPIAVVVLCVWFCLYVCVGLCTTFKEKMESKTRLTKNYSFFYIMRLHFSQFILFIYFFRSHHPPRECKKRSPLHYSNPFLTHLLPTQCPAMQWSYLALPTQNKWACSSLSIPLYSLIN